MAHGDVDVRFCEVAGTSGYMVEVFCCSDQKICGNGGNNHPSRCLEKLVNSLKYYRKTGRRDKMLWHLFKTVRELI